ncbi:MAG: VOC family protein [Pseudomonadota bacterium]
MTEHPVKGIDHLFALVHDLDASRAGFERLGFTVAPRGLHSAHMGTANHTIMFRNDYFEVIGIVAATPDNRPRQEMLAREGEGLRAVACRIGDAKAAEAALEALGIRTNGLKEFSRPVELPAGGEGKAAFTTLQFHPDITPRGIMFMCQHHTPQTVWVPELLNHANGAVGLAGVVAVSDDPAALGEEFARLYAAGAVHPADGGVRVETGAGSAPIFVMTPQALAAAYPGIDVTGMPKAGYAVMRVATEDLGKARSVLATAGVTALATSAGVAVAPADASGMVLEFVPA